MGQVGDSRKEQDTMKERDGFFFLRFFYSPFGFSLDGYAGFSLVG